MATTKASLLQQNSVSHQQGLVDLLNKDVLKPKKIVIPGGKTILEQLDQETLEQAVYNWLRGTAFFEEVTISFARDISKWENQEELVMPLPDDNPNPIWMIHQEGKRYIARLMAKEMRDRKMIYIKVKRDGIYVGLDVKNKFSPTHKVTKKEAEGTDLEVGSVVYNDFWEPYIEFKSKVRAKYGR